MIYFENASGGAEGFNTHVMSWTLCISLSNFLGRDLYFDYEIPCSTPPDYASQPQFAGKFKLLLESQRSLVSQLMDIPNRRVFEIDRDTGRKAEFQLLYSHFATTDEMKKRFEGTMIWDSFAVGRICQTREEIAEYDLIEWTHTKLANPSIFYFLTREEKRDLLHSIRIKYIESIEVLAAAIGNDVGEHYAAHIRLGDYIQHYGVDGYGVDAKRFRSYVRSIFPDESLPVLLATDGLHEKETFLRIFDGYRLLFIDELIFDHYLRDFSQLEFTDFNAITIINQLLCASADRFIGTYRSTFTSIIHRLRQERHQKADFEFFPDEKVAMLLNGDGRIAPDRHGFFDWNRYSVFAENHSSMSWMREWDHRLSAIDI